MQFGFSKPLPYGTDATMQRIGYQAFFDRQSNKASWVRPLGKQWHPRFHAFISIDGEGRTIIDLHFDGKKPMHKRGTSIVENDSPVVQAEVQRIHQIVASWFK